MTTINAKDVKDLCKTRRELLDLKGWLLLEKIAAWCKGTPPRCTTSLDALRGVFGWSRTTIILRLDRFERLNLLQRRRRFQQSTVFTLTLDRLSKSPELDFHSTSESPDESPEVDENQPIEANTRAREGTAEAQRAEAAAVPCVQRARSHPARHPAHPLKSPAVKHALAHERASLRSGDGALAGARRATPAPAPAQQFDIEEWTPTPEQLGELLAVKPQLGPEVIAEQVDAFRVWARSQDRPPKFRNVDECMRRLKGWVRGTHTPRAAAKPKGSAGAERASSAKPAKATKTARTRQPRTMPMDEAKLNGKRRRAAPRREVSMDDVRRLAEQAGGYDLQLVADDSGHVVVGDDGIERTLAQAGEYLRRRIERRATPVSKDDKPQEMGRRHRDELKRLAERAGCRLQFQISGPFMNIIDDRTGAALRDGMSALEASGYLHRRVVDRKAKSKSERLQSAREFEALVKLARTAGCRLEQATRGKVVVYFPHKTMKGREDLIVLKREAVMSWLQNRLQLLRALPASAVPQ